MDIIQGNSFIYNHLNMFNKIVLAGGSGYLGQVLAAYYLNKSKEIIVLSRKAKSPHSNVKYIQWDGKTKGDWVQHLDNCDMLINLSGKNVNCRYTAKNREEIFRSRLEPTEILGKAIAELKSPPKLWINLGSSTIYRHADDHYQDEAGGETGSGFSVEVCKAWEKIFWIPQLPLTRKIILRTAVVIGKRSQIMPRLINLVRFGLGGRQGNGKQYISWLHEEDFARITEWIHMNGKNGEIYNCASPHAVTNEEFMKVLRKALKIPFGLPSPKWLLEIGAFFIGTETELVLKSRWVYPKKLLENGFEFKYPELEGAVREIVGGKE